MTQLTHFQVIKYSMNFACVLCEYWILLVCAELRLKYNSVDNNTNRDFFIFLLLIMTLMSLRVNSAEQLINREDNGIDIKLHSWKFSENEWNMSLKYRKSYLQRHRDGSLVSHEKTKLPRLKTQSGKFAREIRFWPGWVNKSTRWPSLFVIRELPHIFLTCKNCRQAEPRLLQGRD